MSGLRYLIEIDRKGYNDAVFYDDDNPEFHKYVTQITGYKEQYGSFSDISNLCPACGVSGVNLSSGYYNPHTLQEFVVVSEMVHTADIVMKLILDTVQNDVPAFQYIEAYYEYGGHGAFSGYADCAGAEFYFYENGAEKYAYYDCLSVYDAIGQLIMEHPTITWNDVTDYNMY